VHAGISVRSVEVIVVQKCYWAVACYLFIGCRLFQAFGLGRDIRGVSMSVVKSAHLLCYFIVHYHYRKMSRSDDGYGPRDLVGYGPETPE
jgi:hypothetical protein